MAQLKWEGISDEDRIFLREYDLENKMRHKVAVTGILNSSKLKCDRCGRCCVEPLVFVSKREQARLAEHFGLDTESFGGAYMMDEFHLKRPCPFFVRHNSCLVYHIRPETCRAYPFRVDKPFLYLDPECAIAAAIYGFYQEHKAEIDELAQEAWHRRDEADAIKCREIYTKAGFNWDDRAPIKLLEHNMERERESFPLSLPNEAAAIMPTWCSNVAMEETLREMLNPRSF
jgi:Fe-S-cluster containining protein